MTRKRRRVGDYVRVPPEQDSGWLSQVAGKMGMGLYRRAHKVGSGVKLQFGDPRDARTPFWEGVTVGHWFVGPLETWNKHFNKTHICVSQCGVVAFYEPWQIGANKLPETCVACRRGEQEPVSCRTLPESEVQNIQLFWGDSYMATVFDEKSNLQGKDVNKAWDTFGRPLMCKVTDQSGYGRNFGWKINLNDCSHKPNLRHGRHIIRVKEIHLSMRQIAIMMRPADCEYEFNLTLCTGRTDYAFKEVADRIKQVCETICPRDKSADPLYGTTAKPPAPEPVAAAATPIQNASVLITEPVNGEAMTGTPIVDLAKLGSLAANIDKVMKIGKEINDIAAIKLVAAEKLKQAEERLSRTENEFQGIESNEVEIAGRWKHLCEQVEELTRKVKNLTVDRDSEREKLTTIREAMRAKGVEKQTLKTEVEKARKEVAEAVEMEEEHAKAIGGVGNLRGLLEALAKMG